MSLAQALTAELDRIIRNRIEKDKLVVPALPATATKCLTMLKDPNVNLKRVIGLLEGDPVFAALVLKAASAAAFGGQAVRSLEQASTRLGINALKSLLLQASARSLFESPDRQIAARLANVWKHSVAVAVMARDVGALMQVPEVEACYLAGLLHDVGKPVVASILAEVERSLGRKTPVGVEDWSAVVDATHRPVGVALAEKWNIAPEVVSAIRDCLEYDAGDRRGPSNVVRFSNALVKKHGFAAGPVDQEDVGALIMIGRSMLGLEEDVVNRLAQSLRERVESIGNAVA
ncbi:MAG: HDOD domain-containing protein [Deltaproteobacteria bacterium]|nr:HDOD domain-containing protein [Deltaproteobacteria bacterium]